jgi:hypothetical protein
MAEFGKTSPGNEPDITGANHGNTHVLPLERDEKSVE